MTEKTDRKLREVVVAQYAYRHEAEFAAGFLDEADIPYRLQIDDPAMGLTIAAPAMLWVRGMDVDLARDVLDLPPAVGPRVAAVRPGPVSSSGRGRRGALEPRERLASVTLSMVILITGRIFLSDSSSPVVMGTVAVIAAGLVIAAVVGRAPVSVRHLLRALSGDHS